MSRKTRREAYAKILASLGEYLKKDPIGFQRDYTRYKYLKSTLLFLFLLWSFEEVLVNFISGQYEFLTILMDSYQILAAFAVVFFGLLLYLFREKYRYYYGLVEIAFACSLIAVSISQLTSSDSAGLFSLGTAVYVLVRGIDNIAIGFKQ